MEVLEDICAIKLLLRAFLAFCCFSLAILGLTNLCFRALLNNDAGQYGVRGLTFRCQSAAFLPKVVTLIIIVDCLLMDRRSLDSICPPVRDINFVAKDVILVLVVSLVTGSQTSFGRFNLEGL